MRFNSPEHLATWQATGRFPAIHDGLANLAVAEIRGRRIVDVGCSYGLLGARIVTEAGLETGIGVDIDSEVLAAARDAGVPLTFHEFKVTSVTLPALGRLLDESNIDALIARRILPELFGDDLTGGQRFAAMLAEIGVKEIFLEGRIASVKSVNALRSIAEEVDLLAPWFREVRRAGALSYLAVR